jgi:hypothetical protein
MIDAGDPSLMPFATTGTTPDGSLDDVRYLRVSYMTGFCQPGYYFDLFATAGSDPVVVVQIPHPFMELSPTTVAAIAWLPSDFYSKRTDQARFEVVQLDTPAPSQPLRVAGRVTVNDGAWNFDFTVDATTEQFNCI